MNDGGVRGHHFDAYLFRSRLTPKTPRSIASTASGANGTATPSLRDTLVFDIDEVARMLGQEMDARYWARLTLDPVRYADQYLSGIGGCLGRHAAQFIDGVKLPEMVVPEFLAGTSLLKGAANKSEREVRIVAIPGTAKMAKYAAKEYPDQFDATAPLRRSGPAAIQGSATLPCSTVWACDCRPSRDWCALPDWASGCRAGRGRSDEIVFPTRTVRPSGIGLNC
jgi:hypothetical protein